MTKSSKIILSFLSIAFVFVFAFAAGVLAGRATEYEFDSDFKAIEDAWRVITEDYIDKDNIDTRELSRVAIEAMMDLIDDPYSAYLDSQAWHDSMKQLEGTYEGIGAEVMVGDDGMVVIVAPYAGSPAELAGIKPGDKILAIDGVSADGMTHVDVAIKVRGPKGTTVELTVFRPEENRSLDIVIVRDEIIAKSVRYVIEDSYAHITIGSFTEKTNQELGITLKEIETFGVEGIILDLRNNLGGLVDSVVDVTSRFITEGVVFTMKYSDGREVVYKVNQQKETTDLPMVVLVNRLSASGSEVLAGALQDYGRAVVAGATTYGKGSVNVLTPIGVDQGLHITVARWLTPNGHLIEGNGIEPDELLALSGSELVGWAIGFLQNS